MKFTQNVNIGKYINTKINIGNYLVINSEYGLIHELSHKTYKMESMINNGYIFIQHNYDRDWYEEEWRGAYQK